jgi:hypothetical protein
MLVLALVLFLGNIAESDLRFDNVFYATLSKSVLYGENFLKINFAGSPYFNKPPLFFWINSIPIYILGNSVFTLIHFISPKYERYLYLISPFLSIWTVIGLISYFKKFDFDSFIKKFTIIALIFIFTAIIPINQSSQQNSVLKNVKKIAEKNNCSIIIEQSFFNYWKNKAAIYYFLEPIPNKNKYIFISKPNSEELNNILALNKKMKIVFLKNNFLTINGY